MTLSDRQMKDLRHAIVGLLEGRLTAEEESRLRTHLAESHEARKIYAGYAAIRALLELEAPTLAGTDGVGFDVHPMESNPQSLIPNPSFIPPIVIDPSPIHHSPLSSFVFSHIAAAVILGIGLLVGLAWRISLPSPGTQGPQFVSVGHITALADCKWTKQGPETREEGRGERGEIPISKSPNRQIPVFLGDRLVLSAGLMQITYDTGANVILQGPCTYDIDSECGGYLAVGKLTAKVEKGPGVRGPGSGNTNHSPLSSLPTPLFAVRTPTAVVTDLGTEFGVEVEPSGATRSHVFQGSVELRASNQQKSATSNAPTEILHAGQSARVERSRNQKAVIVREPNQSALFVRHIRKGKRGEGRGERKTNQKYAYRLTDLGSLGGMDSCPHALSSDGRVVGESMTGQGVSHAFVFAEGQMKDLGSLLEENSCAMDVNSRGQVVGWSGRSQKEGRAFLFADGRMKDLGTLGGSTACASAINESGQIAGFSQNRNGKTRAFLISKGVMRPLGAAEDLQSESWAHGINDNGLVVGHVLDLDGITNHAVLFNAGDRIRVLGLVDGQGSMARRINNSGLVVGFFMQDGLRRAFVYDKNTAKKSNERIVLSDGVELDIDRRIQRLGTFGGGESLANDINRHGHVVGIADCIPDGDYVERHAFLYADGRMIDLNTRIHSTLGWVLIGATAINDSGQIAGYGTAPDGSVRTFLLTPMARETRNEGSRFSDN